MVSTDKSVKVPKYRLVEEYLTSLIRENSYPPGTLLPSETTLCQHLRVSRTTVRQAHSKLIGDGLIYIEQGRGTFVAEPARNQRSEHHEIGIVLNDIDQLRHPFFSEYIRGIQQEINLHECSIHLIFTRKNSEASLDFRREKNVLGLIIISHEVNYDNYIRSLQQKRIPFVWFASYDPTGKLPCIHLDKQHGLFVGVDHLVKLGHRDIAFIAGNPAIERDYQDKMEGFLQAMERLEIPVRREWIVDGCYTTAGAEKALDKILSTDATPTALIHANDIMALAVLNALQRKGRRVPEEFSVVGFDDITDASTSSPTLTTIHVPMERMGREAARILFDMIEHDDTSLIHQMNVEPKLVVRESTGPAPSEENQSRQKRLHVKHNPVLV